MMFEVMRVLASRLSQTTAELSAELAESRKASAQGAH
jgi:hypothetical protein